MKRIIQSFVLGLVSEIRNTFSTDLGIPTESMKEISRGTKFKGGIEVCLPYRYFSVVIQNDGKISLRFHGEFYSEFPAFDFPPLESCSWKKSIPVIRAFIEGGVIPKEQCKKQSGSSLGAEVTYTYDDIHRHRMAKYFPLVWNPYIKEKFFSSKDRGIQKELDVLFDQYIEKDLLSFEQWENTSSLRSALVEQADLLRKQVGEKRAVVV